jgi:hypothetical protein
MNARTGRQRVHPNIRQVYDAVVSPRMFWGTGITQFTEALPWLSGHDLELVMGHAFCDWIGWKDTGQLT